MLKKLGILVLALCAVSIQLPAENPSDPIAQDTISQTLSKRQLRRERVKNRNFHYNILGGPSYTPDYGVLIGGSALMTFRTNPKDTTLLRSVFPFSIAVMFKGGMSIGTRPQLFFKSDRFRIFGQLNYKNILDNYYGVGFTTNKNRERGKETTEFRFSGIQVNPWFLFRIKESNFFVGPQVDLNYDEMKKPSKGVTEDPSYIAAGGTESGYRNFSSGLGFIITYDTRDVPSNAYKGIYFDTKGSFYNKILGSNNNFYRLDLEYRQYKLVGKRKVIAWTAQSKNVFGNVPLTRYSLTGTPFDLRGYYNGQYRDKTSHVVMAEYRQMFNTDKSNFIKRIISHLGFVAWGGCGFMGPGPFKIEGVLPNLGAGLRIEIQPRMNVRVDFGRDMVNKANLFYVNMTEAF